MSDEEMRAAIAEKCGWKVQAAWHTQCVVCQLPTGELVPDPINDLNAMHEAELTMDEQAYRMFIAHLVSLLKPGEFSVRAPACLRAQAFLRTFGLWTNPTPAERLGQRE